MNQATHQQNEDVRVSQSIGEMQLDFIPDNGQPSYLITTFRSQQGIILTFQANKMLLRILKSTILKMKTISVAIEASITPKKAVRKTLSSYLLLAIFIL